MGCEEGRPDRQWPPGQRLAGVGTTAVAGCCTLLDLDRLRLRCLCFRSPRAAPGEGTRDFWVQTNVALLAIPLRWQEERAATPGRRRDAQHNARGLLPFEPRAGHASSWAAGASLSLVTRRAWTGSPSTGDAPGSRRQAWLRRGRRQASGSAGGGVCRASP